MTIYKTLSEFPPKPIVKSPIPKTAFNGDTINALALSIKLCYSEDKFNLLLNYMHDMIIYNISTKVFITNSTNADVYNYAALLLLDNVRHYNQRKGYFYNFYLGNLKRKLKTYIKLDQGNEVNTYISKTRVNNYYFNRAYRLDSVIKGKDDNATALLDILITADKDRQLYESKDWYNEALKIIDQHLSPHEQYTLRYWLANVTKTCDRTATSLKACTYEPSRVKAKTNKERCKALDNSMQRIRAKIQRLKPAIWPMIREL